MCRTNVVEKLETDFLFHVLVTVHHIFDVFLTVHHSIFILVINQLEAQNFCFTISLFHASTGFFLFYVLLTVHLSIFISVINLLGPELFFLILAHPVYKM